MKKLLISICVAVGVYFAFSNTIDEFLYPEKRPGLNTYDTYTTTTQQTTTAVTQQTPIVYNVPLVKTQMKKIIVTAKTLYSHPKNVSKIYAALHTDLAW